MCMLTARCLQEIKNRKNQVVSYIIYDNTGYMTRVEPEKLKKAMLSNKIQIENLVLTQNNEIIKNNNLKPKPIPAKSNKLTIHSAEVHDLLNKARFLGALKEINDKYNKRRYYIISESEYNHLIIIPDETKHINSCTKPDPYIRGPEGCIKGNIKVIGGSGLESGEDMFSCGLCIDTLDLSCLDTSNMKTMKQMFGGSSIKNIILSNFDTSKVTDMESMFFMCDTPLLDLSSFDTSKVTSMTSMFERCSAKYINTLYFDTSNVYYMTRMFDLCQVKFLDLSSFETNKLKSTKYMFFGCSAQYINMDSFKTGLICTADRMFQNSQVQYLDLSSFELVNCERRESLFKDCAAASLKATDQILLKAFRRRHAI